MSMLLGVRKLKERIIFSKPSKTLSYDLMHVSIITSKPVNNKAVGRYQLLNKSGLTMLID
mgnify:CR=1 FL=1